MDTCSSEESALQHNPGNYHFEHESRVVGPHSNADGSSISDT